MESILNRIEDLTNKLADKGQRKILVNYLGKGYKPKVNRECAIISKTLKSDGIDEFSEMTVYRLLKVKELNPKLYDEIKRGNIKIKQAYNLLFPPTIKEKKKEVEIVYVAPIGEGEPDFNELLELLKGRAEQLEEWQYKLTKDPDLSVINEIDKHLFRLRKATGRIITKYTDFGD